MNRSTGILVAMLLLIGSETAFSTWRMSVTDDDFDFDDADQPEVDLSLAKEIQELGSLVLQRKVADALVLSETLTDQLTHNLKAAKSNHEKEKIGESLIFTLVVRMYAHREKMQPFEAVLFAIRASSLCRRLPAHICQKNDSWDQINLLRSSGPNFIQSTPASVAFGISPNDVGDKKQIGENFRRLANLLHPDKNMDLDEEAQRELGHIFAMFKTAYLELKRSAPRQ